MEVKTIVCKCGNKVELLSGWANECSCGIEFNGFGQELAPRGQWGSETGEYFGGIDDEN